MLNHLAALGYVVQHHLVRVNQVAIDDWSSLNTELLRHIGPSIANRPFTLSAYSLHPNEGISEVVALGVLINSSLLS